MLLKFVNKKNDYSFISVKLILSVVFLLTQNISFGEIIKKEVPNHKIQGYYPYFQSVGAELLTQISTDNVDKKFPYTFLDDNVTKSLTIGSIVYIPDLFCSLNREELATLRNDPGVNSLSPYLNHFDFVDTDEDICDPRPNNGVKIKWYLVDDIVPWRDDLIWSDLTITPVPEANIIKVGSNEARDYQKTHSYSPLKDKLISLNTLDAMKVPEEALGKRIAFSITPTTSYGVPKLGPELYAWDLFYFFKQNPPLSAGDFDTTAENNLGQKAARNPSDELNSGELSTAGGVVQLGRPPYVRSIGAQYEPAITSYQDQQTDSQLTYYLDYMQATSNQQMEGALPMALIGGGGGYVYLPDAFCQYSNNDMSEIAQLNALKNSVGFPIFPNNSNNAGEKFKFFRPLFWIADAEEDSCDIEANQIEWFMVEPIDARINTLKAMVNDFYTNPIYQGNTRDWNEFEQKFNQISELSSQIWSDVDGWEDVRPIPELKPEPLTPKDNPEGIKFSGIGNQYISAARIPYNPTQIRWLAQPGFIFTPKTKTGRPDHGREIKVPVAVSRIWGQLPSNRPTTLLDEKPGSEWMNNNSSTDGILISAYPQFIEKYSGIDKDTLDASVIQNAAHLDFNCLMDVNKTPARDCVKPLPKNRVLVSQRVAYLPSDGFQYSMPNLKSNMLEGGFINYAHLEGRLKAGETIKVIYGFNSLVTSNPLDAENRTVYEFYPQTTSPNLTINSKPAGDNRVLGHNEFLLPELTEAQIGETYRLTLRPYNGRYMYHNDVNLTTESLMIKAPPSIVELQINSNEMPIKERSILTATYRFVKGDYINPGSDASKFSWITDDGNTRTQEESISITGQVGPYEVKNEDVGKTISLAVRAIDTNEIEGDTAYASIEVPESGPEIGALTIQETFETSAIITGSYTIVNNSISQNNSRYEWLANGSDILKSGRLTDLSGQVNGANAYTVMTKDVGKAITLRIIPEDQTGRIGETILSSNSVTYKAPAISELRTSTARPEMDKATTVNFDFIPGSQSTDKSIINWYLNNIKNGNQTKTFTPQAADAGKVLKVEVIAQDANNIQGNTKTKTFESVFDGYEDGTGWMKFNLGKNPLFPNYKIQYVYIDWVDSTAPLFSVTQMPPVKLKLVNRSTGATLDQTVSFVYQDVPVEGSWQGYTYHYPVYGSIDEYDVCAYVDLINHKGELVKKGKRCTSGPHNQTPGQLY
ncbi:hypothetical protein [Thorsellia kenyensis]|uniref:Ig-like domain-containing protein n=1 Tax=Thorsellia kenyensis TaxID=1549888 RepID=A0ABV6CBL0_9GAMM